MGLSKFSPPTDNSEVIRITLKMPNKSTPRLSIFEGVHPGRPYHRPPGLLFSSPLFGRILPYVRNRVFHFVYS